MVEWTGMTSAEPRRLVQGILGSGLAVLSILFMVDAGPGLFLAAAIAFPAAAALAARGTTGKLWAVAGFPMRPVIVLVPPIVRDHLDLGISSACCGCSQSSGRPISRPTSPAGRFGGPKLWPGGQPEEDLVRFHRRSCSLRRSAGSWWPWPAVVTV